MEEKDTSLINKAWDYYDKEDYEQARIYFEQALAAGDMTAACELGNLYYWGNGVDQDYQRAVKYYEIGAKKGDVDCIANLGRCYYWGRGVKINLELSAFYCEKAAKAGDSTSMYDTALNYQRGLGVKPDMKKCLYWLEQAAENGEASAFVELGNVYLHGEGVRKNEKKTVAYYEKGAEAGDHLAMLLLAPYYEKGKHVEQDLSKAEKLYRESFDYYYEQAVKGNQKAQLRLGNIHFYDGIPMIDVPQDYVEAARWYEKSAEQGEPQAQINMGNLYYFGIGVEQNYSKAAYWYRLAAEKNDEIALCNLANAYSLGRGVKQDDAKAAELYRKAANLGYPNAQIELAKHYLEGKGVEQNFTYAIEWLEKACDNGAIDAFGYLGDCYLEGKGVEKDEEKAFALYQEGASQNDLETKVRLAEAYIEGWGTPPDSRKAIDILTKVCDNEEEYRDQRITVQSRSDDMGGVFIENPLDPLYLKHYAKANYLLGVLKYAGGDDKPDPNEAIRRLRMADKLGYVDEKHPNQTAAALLDKIIGNTPHEEIQDTIDSYVEIRDENPRNGERYQVYIHHADGSESKVKFQGRDKFFYILCLMAAHEGSSVSGITTRHFQYLKEPLIDLVSQMRVGCLSIDRWIDEFTYSDRRYAQRDKDSRHTWDWDTHTYSVALNHSKNHVTKACISEEEKRIFVHDSTKGKNSVTRLALNSNQIIIPDSLMDFLDILPTPEEIDSFRYRPTLTM